MFAYPPAKRGDVCVYKIRWKNDLRIDTYFYKSHHTFVYYYVEHWLRDWKRLQLYLEYLNGRQGKVMSLDNYISRHMPWSKSDFELCLLSLISSFETYTIPFRTSVDLSDIFIFILPVPLSSILIVDQNLLC